MQYKTVMLEAIVNREKEKDQIIAKTSDYMERKRKYARMNRHTKYAKSKILKIFVDNNLTKLLKVKYLSEQVIKISFKNVFGREPNYKTIKSLLQEKEFKKANRNGIDRDIDEFTEVLQNINDTSIINEIFKSSKTLQGTLQDLKGRE